MKKFVHNTALFTFGSIFVIPILALVLSIFFYSKDEINVKSKENIVGTVQVVDSYENTTGGTIFLVGTTPICTPRVTHYITTVKYKEKEYKIDDSNTYNQFKNKKGQNVKATIKKITYKDKKIKYEVNELYEE